MTNAADDVHGLALRLAPAMRAILGSNLIQSDQALWQKAIGTVYAFDHFDDAAFGTAWSHAAYTPFNSAGLLAYLNLAQSMMVFQGTVGDNVFYSRAYSSLGYVMLRVASCNDSYIGVRVDDGSNTNSYHIFIENGTTAGTVRIVRGRIIAGVGNGVTLIDNLPHGFYNLGIQVHATLTSAFYGTQTPCWKELEYVSGVGFTPTRCGIMFGQRVFANFDRRAMIDWFLYSSKMNPY